MTPKMEDVKSEVYVAGEPMRQTVLMWGAPPPRTPPRNNGSYSPPASARSAGLDRKRRPSFFFPILTLAEIINLYKNVKNNC